MPKRDPVGEGEEKAGQGLPRLPPGRHGLGRDFVVKNQRDRLAAGIIAVVAEHGYHEATITQIAAAAGVSRRTFYGYFSSKEDCFDDTYAMIAAHLLQAAREAAASEAEWPARARAKLRSLLEAFGANPDLARFMLIAPSRAGQGIAARQREVMERALEELTDGMPPPPATRRVSRAAELALAGGTAALISHKVEAGEGERLPELLPDLLELVLAPYLGRPEAVRVSRQAPRQGQR